MLLILFYGGYLVMQDQLSLGVFVVFYQIAFRLMDDSNELFNLLMGVPNRLVAISNLSRTLQTTNLKIDNSKLKSINEPINEVAFEKIYLLNMKTLTLRYLKTLV